MARWRATSERVWACVWMEVFRVRVTVGWNQHQSPRVWGTQLTLGDEGMHGGELGVLGVVGGRAGDEVFEEEEVAWAALHDGKQPVAELQPAAARVSLSCEKVLRERGAVVRVGVGGRRWGR